MNSNRYNRRGQRPYPAAGCDDILLTPQQYLEFDAIARRRVGRTLLVRDRLRDMSGDYGCVGGLNPDLIVDVFERRRGCTDMYGGVIGLSNSIPYAEFCGAARPECDWSAVPRADAYRFIVEHEIAHCSQDTLLPLIELEVLRDRKQLIDYRRALEVDADRKAWARLYPGTPMPRKRGVGRKRDHDRLLKRWSRALNRSWSRWPLPVDGTQYMPISHHREGIPFVNSQSREVAPKNALDVVAHQRLVEREHVWSNYEKRAKMENEKAAA